MVQKLKKSQTKLKQSNLELEARVKARTQEIAIKSKELEHKHRELEDAYTALKAVSITDPLTAANNRRFISQQLPIDIVITSRTYDDWLYKRSDIPPQLTDLVFYMLDIDHFKQVNDHYGHDRGDQLLVQLSGLIRSFIRKSDYFIRWGGEEFLVVTRFVNRDFASDYAERVRQLVADTEFDLGNDLKIHKTCSIGFAAYPFDRRFPAALTWNEVIELSDKALYAAKNSGRNTWVGIQSSGEANGENQFNNIINHIPELAFCDRLEIVTSLPTKEQLIWK